MSKRVKHVAEKRKEVATYDVSKFASSEAEKRFEMLKEGSYIEERGLNIENPDSGKYDSDLTLHLTFMVVHHGWTEFIKKPTKFYPSLVREFLANLEDKHDDDTCFVRGKWVPFDAESINKVYGFPNAEEDELSSLLSNKSDNYAQVFDVLTRGGEIEWVKGASKSIKTEGFSREARVWLNFVMNRFFPTLHRGSIPCDIAFLIFCILVGKTINVGKEILATLKTFRVANKTPMWFPSLITTLCLAAGVRVSSREPSVQTSEITVKDMINRMKGELYPNSAREYYLSRWFDEQGNFRPPVDESRQDPVQGGRVQRREGKHVTREEFESLQKMILETHRCTLDRMAAYELARYQQQPPPTFPPCQHMIEEEEEEQNEE